MTEVSFLRDASRLVHGVVPATEMSLDSSSRSLTLYTTFIGGFFGHIPAIV